MAKQIIIGHVTNRDYFFLGKDELVATLLVELHAGGTFLRRCEDVRFQNSCGRA